jgi:hypothetical protein
MRKNITNVLLAFKVGNPHREKTCWTDGRSVFSYDLKIATMCAGGYQVILRGPSKTTNEQIGACAMALPNAERVQELR